MTPLTGEIPPNVVGFRNVDLLWTLADQRRAEREGWALFETNIHGLEIERDDERKIFIDDESAIRHCFAMADRSTLHARALAIHFHNLATRED